MTQKEFLTKKIAEENLELKHLELNWVWHIVMVGVAMMAMLFGLRLFRLKDIMKMIVKQ